MPSVFSLIIAGNIPGNFVWADDVCVAFATIEPCSPGHVLVVPREEVDNLVDADPQLVAHLFTVAQTIGKSATKAFGKARAGIVVAGFDVPHLHVHVIPADTMSDMAMANAHAAEADDLRAAMEKLRAGLIADGHAANVPKDLSSPALS